MTFRHLVIAAVAMSGSPAMAPPKLLSVSPAANATAAKISTTRLVFSERLMPKLSPATLVMIGMPGMANYPDMKVPGVTKETSPDGKAIALNSAKPLPAGTNRIDWIVVGADTYRITGKHAFSIR